MLIASSMNNGTSARGASPSRAIMHYVPAFSLALLLHALAVAAAAGWFTWTSSPHTRPDTQATRTIAVFSVGPEDSRFPGLNPLDSVGNDWRTPSDVPADVSEGAFTFDVGKIAGRAQVLFPFVTPGLAWEHFVLMPERTIYNSLQNPLAAGRSRRERGVSTRPLDADDSELQRLIDQSWSRRHRWDAFEPIVSLAQKYNADAGRLPNLLQQYCDQNSLQPYADTTMKDPRLWVQLGIAADHVDFIGFIRRYTSDHPSTKATTTLLFLLDNIAQGSRDALAPLLEIRPREELAWTRNANPRAYDLILRLHDYYKRELNRRGLTSAEAITVHYETVRLAILAEIVRTSPDGYRAGDARFLMGAIYWRQQRFREALQSWRQMTIDANDTYVEAYSQLLRVVQRDNSRLTDGAAGLDPTLSRDINHILRNAQGRWLMSSFDRLHQFGYRIDTF